VRGSGGCGGHRPLQSLAPLPLSPPPPRRRAAGVIRVRVDSTLARTLCAGGPYRQQVERICGTNAPADLLTHFRASEIWRSCSDRSRNGGGGDAAATATAAAAATTAAAVSIVTACTTALVDGTGLARAYDKVLADKRRRAKATPCAKERPAAAAGLPSPNAPDACSFLCPQRGI
jgi:hypothetical protein